MCYAEYGYSSYYDEHRFVDLVGGYYNSYSLARYN